MTADFAEHALFEVWIGLVWPETSFDTLFQPKRGVVFGPNVFKEFQRVSEKLRERLASHIFRSRGVRDACDTFTLCIFALLTCHEDWLR